MKKKQKFELDHWLNEVKKSIKKCNDKYELAELISGRYEYLQDRLDPGRDLHIKILSLILSYIWAKETLNHKETETK